MATGLRIRPPHTSNWVPSYPEVVGPNPTRPRTFSSRRRPASIAAEDGFSSGGPPPLEGAVVAQMLFGNLLLLQEADEMAVQLLGHVAVRIDKVAFATRILG